MRHFRWMQGPGARGSAGPSQAGPPWATRAPKTDPAVIQAPPDRTPAPPTSSSRGSRWVLPAFPFPRSQTCTWGAAHHPQLGLHLDIPLAPLEAQQLSYHFALTDFLKNSLNQNKTQAKTSIEGTHVTASIKSKYRNSERTTGFTGDHFSNP